MIYRKGHNDYFDTQITDYGEVKELVITEKSQMSSIGGALLQQAEKRFADEGLDYMRIKVSVDNSVGLNFYRKNGYEIDQVELIKQLA